MIGHHGHCPSRVDEAPRMALGLLGLAATSVLARRPTVGRIELAAFRALNDLPDDRSHVVWTVMQSGSLAAVPAVAGISWRCGHPGLARRLLLAGCEAWLAAKLVKRVVHRPRPVALLPAVTCRGGAATGLGYLSGHTGVVTALVAVAGPNLPRPLRPVLAALIPLVAGARVYVGAHLPLDVLGGASLGIAVGAANVPARHGRPGHPRRIRSVRSDVSARQG